MNAHPHETPFLPEEPRPLLREIEAPAAYPIAALGPLRAVVEAVQGMTQAPMAIPAQSALGCAALIVQGHADVETLGGRRPTSLYALTIAQSGERKSSCDSRIMEPLRRYETEQRKAQREGRLGYEKQRALWIAKRERLLAEVKKDNRDAFEIEADLDALGPEPVAPPSPDRTVSEPTLEGLIRKFVEGMPTLGMFSDEGGQFLGGFAMNSDNRQKTLAALNKLWQGDPIDRTRASETSFTLEGLRLSVNLMVQPGVARHFLSDPMGADTGFLPRFLICAPESTIGTRLHSLTKNDAHALEAFGQRLREILETPLPMVPETRALTPRFLPLDPEARERLTIFSDAIEVLQAPDKELRHVTGFASKAAEHAARIAGVLTLFRDLDAIAVTAEDMANGIELAQFYLFEAKRLMDAATVSPEIRQAELLRKWLLEKWQDDVILPSEIVQSGPHQMRETPKVKAALTVLEKHGWIKALPKGTEVRGRSRREAYWVWRPSHIV